MIYLRFNAPTGWLSGESTLEEGERKNIVVSGSEDFIISSTENSILVPYYYDAHYRPGQKLLEVEGKKNGLVAIACVDNLKTHQRRLFRSLFLKEKLDYSSISMEKDKKYNLPVSTKKLESGVIVPYNPFTIQPISIIKDKRVPLEVKERMLSL